MTGSGAFFESALITTAVVSYGVSNALASALGKDQTLVAMCLLAVAQQLIQLNRCEEAMFVSEVAHRWDKFWLGEDHAIMETRLIHLAVKREYSRQLADFTYVHGSR